MLRGQKVSSSEVSAGASRESSGGVGVNARVNESSRKTGK